MNALDDGKAIKEAAKSSDTPVKVTIICYRGQYAHIECCTMGPDVYYKFYVYTPWDSNMNMQDIEEDTVCNPDQLFENGFFSTKVCISAHTTVTFVQK